MTKRYKMNIDDNKTLDYGYFISKLRSDIFNSQLFQAYYSERYKAIINWQTFILVES